MRRSALPLALLMVVGLSLPASAERLVDPDDVRGKLDLSLVVGRKDDASDPLRIRIETYENWGARLLKASGKNRVWILFNVDADRRVEYVGTITSSKGVLGLDIEGSGSAFETLPVRHPNRHTLKTTIPGSSPPNPDGVVRIAVKSRYVSKSGACSDRCRDRAPNGGFLAVA